MPAHRSPRDLGPDDLVLSHFTLGRHHAIEERIAAAAAAGIDAIGLYVGDYLRLRDEGRAPGELADLLDEHGVCLAEIEVLRAWVDEPADVERMARFEAAAWELADRFGCRYVQVIGSYVGPFDEAGKAFGALCDRAADHGLVVGLEFLPFTNIVTAADALAIVEQAGRPNGGVCVDIWHHTRGANDIALVEAIPAELVTGIQMSDGTLVPEIDDYYEDCLRRRVPPGEGEFDVVGFVATLLRKGVRVPWALEVCNEDGWAGPAAPWVQRCADGMRAALAAARQRLADEREAQGAGG